EDARGDGLGAPDGGGGQARGGEAGPGEGAVGGGGARRGGEGEGARRRGVVCGHRRGGQARGKLYREGGGRAAGPGAPGASWAGGGTNVAGVFLGVVGSMGSGRLPYAHCRLAGSGWDVWESVGWVGIRGRVGREFRRSTWMRLRHAAVD